METTSAFSLPPGFGFHPTDVELVSHYLKRKILGLKIDCEVIPEVDIYKYEPWDLPAKCHIPTRDSKWHFFTSRDRKYPNGSRSNRATEAGYWKSTGKDRNIRSHNQVIGTKKTLVFHEGRPPCGKRSDWIMHEYYMDETKCKAAPGMKDIFVLCRVTKRNGSVLDDENVSPETEEIHNYPKLPKEVDAPAVPEEKSSLSENVEDIEKWFSELYDPDFCAIPTIVELKSEPEQDFGSLALKQEPVDFPPQFSEGLLLLQSEEDDIFGILQDFDHFDSSVLGEFDIDTIDAASSPQFNAALMTDDLAGGYINNFRSSLIDGNDCKLTPFDPTASSQPTDDSNAGIQIRERRARPAEIPRYRIKLQVHKMESKNGGTMNQTLKLVNQDHHLDLSDGIQYPAGIEVEELEGSSDSKVVRTPMDQAPTLRRRSAAGPLKEETFSTTHPEDLSCIRGPIRGLCVLLRRCSSAGLNCFLLCACMMGTAALILYFLLRDVRRFISSISALGL